MNLGNNIYKFRTQKNMSQGDLADALEVSRQSVSKWENNSAVPELDKLQKMSKLFGVTLDELVTGEAPAPKEPQTIVYTAPEKKPMPRHRFAGLVLLGLGLPVLLVFTFIGYHEEGNIYLGVIFSLPLFFDGMICLICEKQPLFFLLWANFGLFATFSMSIATYNSRIPILSFILLAAISGWTLRKLHQGHFNVGRNTKILWAVLLCILLCAHLWLTLNALFSDVSIRKEYAAFVTWNKF